jgi:hypothetical protein
MLASRLPDAPFAMREFAPARKKPFRRAVLLLTDLVGPQIAWYVDANVTGGEPMARPTLQLVERMRQVAQKEEASGNKETAADFRRRADDIEAGIVLITRRESIAAKQQLQINR